MVAPRLLTPRQLIIKSGTYIVIESIAGATLTCGSQSYTLGSGETIHAFEVTAGTYTCTANKTDYYEASASVTITSGFEYVTLKPTNIPASYQEVEYLYSDGNQYIVTPVTTASNQVIRVKFLISSDSKSNRVFSSVDGSTQLIPQTKTNTSNAYLAMNYASGSSSSLATAPRIAENVVYDFTLHTNTTVTINGVDYANQGNYGGASGNSPIWLFKKNTDTTARMTGNIYLFTITQGGSRIIDLIPCYRKSDSVAGMYDKVTDAFLTNSGSGNFIAGADVI